MFISYTSFPEQIAHDPEMQLYYAHALEELDQEYPGCAYTKPELAVSLKDIADRTWAVIRRTMSLLFGDMYDKH